MDHLERPPDDVRDIYRDLARYLDSLRASRDDDRVAVEALLLDMEIPWLR